MTKIKDGNIVKWVNTEVTPSCWVYAVKANNQGQVTKLKAFIVMCGDKQETSFSKTYTLTILYATICYFLAMVIKHSWEMCLLDILSAYLHAKLKEDMYMQPQPGHPDEFPLGCILHLKKSLYSLKQVGHKWGSLLPLHACACWLQATSQGPVHLHMQQG